MTFLNRFLFFSGMLLYGMLQGQITKPIMENALLIAASNSNKLENSKQLLVVYNNQIDSYSAQFVALEKKDGLWVLKQGPVSAGIGKKGFARSSEKREGDGKSPTGIFRLGKLFSYEKQTKTLLENQQTTAEDKWIDDPNSDQYNTYVSGSTDAKSYENLLLKNDAYKYCMVIEYNTDPVIKGKGSAIFFHLATKKPSYTAGCVAIDEENMKTVISWLDPKQNPVIIMGNLQELIDGL